MTSNNAGTLYIADTNGYRIRSYDVSSGMVGTFAGTGGPGHVDGTGAAASVHRPRGMTTDGTSLYWVEFNRHTVRQGIEATQEVSTMLGTPCTTAGPGMCPGGYADMVGSAAQFDGPFDIEFHFPSNSLFILDGGNARIRRVQ